jgi:CBS domain-containing protein
MDVGRLMTKDVISVTPDTPLREVADILASNGISGVPVVADTEVLGVVSEADIIAKEQGAPLLQKSGFARVFGSRNPQFEARLAARTAGDAMTTPAVTIERFRSIAGAAQLMSEHGVNRLPVLQNGELVGIVTRADLVRAFARPDREIATDIREEVVKRAFWQPTESVTVAVDDGEVVLRGTVESKSVAEALPAAVTRVAGVVGVHSELEWPPDR